VASSKEVQQLSIGHEEAPSTETDVEESEEKESILWANQHADEEFLLLLGDGHDLISADGVLQYRISNLHQYLYQTQNPEELLRAITYRVLMQETVSRTLEEALSENLEVLAKRVNQRISEELTGKNIGIEPVLFSFSALHPPVKVAKDYQEVISAQIDRDTKVLRAEGYRLQALPRVEKEALIAKNQAKEYWASKRAGAVGESFQFEALRQSVRQNTELYLFRKRQESLERNLKGRSLVIIDHRLEQAGAEVWIQE
jgi:membrane protease subunit HflK